MLCFLVNGFDVESTTCLRGCNRSSHNIPFQVSRPHFSFPKCFDLFFLTKDRREIGSIRWDQHNIKVQVPSPNKYFILRVCVYTCACASSICKEMCRCMAFLSVKREVSKVQVPVRNGPWSHGGNAVEVEMTHAAFVFQYSLEWRKCRKSNSLSNNNQLRRAVCLQPTSFRLHRCLPRLMQ